MRRLLLTLALLTVSAFAQTNPTQNFHFGRPAHNAGPGWGVELNTNSAQIDAFWNNVIFGCAADGSHALTWDPTTKFNCTLITASVPVGAVLLTPLGDQFIVGTRRLTLTNGALRVTGAGLDSIFGSPSLIDILANDGTSWALTVRNAIAGTLGGLAVSVSNVGDVSVENGALQNGFLLQANGRVVLTSVGGASISLNANGGSVHVSNGPVLIDSLSINLPVCTDGSKDLITCTVATSQKAETTTADANVLTVTPASVVGTYRACAVISVSSATAGVISWTLSWTDSNGNAQSNIAQDLFQQGTAVPATSFTTSAAGNYNGCTTFDVNPAGANIVAKWVGGGVTSAKMSVTVERLQ